MFQFWREDRTFAEIYEHIVQHHIDRGIVRAQLVTIVARANFRIPARRAGLGRRCLPLFAVNLQSDPRFLAFAILISSVYSSFLQLSRASNARGYAPSRFDQRGKCQPIICNLFRPYSTSESSDLFGNIKYVYESCMKHRVAELDYFDIKIDI